MYIIEPLDILKLQTTYGCCLILNPMHIGSLTSTFGNYLTQHELPQSEPDVRRDCPPTTHECSSLVSLFPCLLAYVSYQIANNIH